MKLSMWKLLIPTLLISSAVYADIDSKVEDFLEDSFGKNPNVSDVDVKVVYDKPLEEVKGWRGVIVDVSAKIKLQTKEQKIKQKMIWFTDGNVISKDLIDLDTGESLRDSVSPQFQASFYKKENLIYGNPNATHKVAIFSDPLCPFCRRFVPKAIAKMKKYPNKFAIYYYHFPLQSLHPASVALTQAVEVARKQGKKDAILKLYDVNINPRERDVRKILKAFNDTMLTNIKPSDLNNEEIKKHLQDDFDIGNEVMVKGTPTMFFDGKLDRSREKYKKAL